MVKTLLILSNSNKGSTKDHSDFLLDRVVSLSNSTSNIFVAARNSVQEIVKIHEYSILYINKNMIILNATISK